MSFYTCLIGQFVNIPRELGEVWMILCTVQGSFCVTVTPVENPSHSPVTRPSWWSNRISKIMILWRCIDLYASIINWRTVAECPPSRQLASHVCWILVPPCHQSHRNQESPKNGTLRCHVWLQNRHLCEQSGLQVARWNWLPGKASSIRTRYISKSWQTGRA